MAPKPLRLPLRLIAWLLLASPAAFAEGASPTPTTLAGDTSWSGEVTVDQPPSAAPKPIQPPPKTAPGLP